MKLADDIEPMALMEFAQRATWAFITHRAENVELHVNPRGWELRCQGIESFHMEWAQTPRLDREDAEELAMRALEHLQGDEP